MIKDDKTLLSLSVLIAEHAQDIGYKGPIIALTGHSLDNAKGHENSFDFDG